MVLNTVCLAKITGLVKQMVLAPVANLTSENSGKLVYTIIRKLLGQSTFRSVFAHVPRLYSELQPGAAGLNMGHHWRNAETAVNVK